MTTVHQRLRDERGLAVSVASFRRYVAANVPEETRRSQVKVLRPVAGRAGRRGADRLRAAGPLAGPGGREACTIWAFVMVLACSRHLFVRPVIRLDQQAWSECHVAAFAFFGGVPARLVPDNLKTGVDRPDLYDPKINRSYAELAAHYGCLVDPARASGGQRTSRRVERPMPYVRDSLVARPGVHLAGADAGRGGTLVRRGRRDAAVPAAGRRGPGRGVRRGGEGRAASRCLPIRSCWPRGPRRR